MKRRYCSRPLFNLRKNVSNLDTSAVGESVFGSNSIFMYIRVGTVKFFPLLFYSLYITLFIFLFKLI